MLGRRIDKNFIYALGDYKKSIQSIGGIIYMPFFDFKVILNK
jgi:hypothetical protein